MSVVLNNLKCNPLVFDVVSGLDKSLFKEYTVRYCSTRNDTVYLILVSEVIDSTMGSRWRRAKSICLEHGIYLDVSIVTQEQYLKWVHHSVKKDPDSPEEWLQRWYKVHLKEPKGGSLGKSRRSYILSERNRALQRYCS